MVSNSNTSVIRRHHKKQEKLALIKERYQKLILEPRKEIESEIDRDLKEDGTVSASDADGPTSLDVV